jgi:glycosyltransferase involved in cell wall biosynthesis
MMKVVNFYSGKANAQTGIGTVLKNLNDINSWSSNGIEYKTIALDGILAEKTKSKDISKSLIEKSLFKKCLSKVRVLWWKLAERSLVFAVLYIEFLYIYRAKQLLRKNHEILSASDYIYVNDLWSILVIKKDHPELLKKVCYVNHSDGELAGFIKNVFPPVSDSRYFKNISNKLQSILFDLNHLVVLSDVAKSRVLATHKQLDENKVSVIYNGFSTDILGPKNNTFDFNNITLHVAGTICARKRQYLLLPIIQKLNSHNIVCNIYGNGPDYDYLNSIVKLSNLTDQIRLHGYYSDPFLNYSQGDFFILLSEKEGLPMAAIEAVSRGCILILTNAGGAKELIELTAGTLIDSNVDDEIVDMSVKAIRDLSSDNKSRLEKSEASLNGYNKYFTSKSMVTSYCSLCLNFKETQQST